MLLDNKNHLVNKNEYEYITKIIKPNNNYQHSEFYKYQRRKLNILIDKEGKPIGNKWTFDEDNRVPFPKDY